MALNDPVGHTQKTLSLVGFLGMALTVGTAVGFQVIGGYIPCKLCYEQRIPYYIGLPILALAVILSFMRGPALITRLLILAGALLMVWALYLGIFHAGVEWGFWPGPTDCGVAVDATSGTSGGVLDSLNTVIPPSCDKAALRVLGLSFAGWQAICAAILAMIMLRGAFARGRA
ncbi:disulfide bond formation protein B [Tianweitania sp. BSSL-BM11]|uniref:Disulfide bond formation protein B n=1 Tax=Tianweitania aestuarii TaxID=2814886 RepID=A0ABS5RZC7_9HYPH|nr:disulfide bond formation protein B [Tianweitania aestuarii]MBS9722395.1 disulfide bond formation protein B [Tianweitania aestuarii]